MFKLNPAPTFKADVSLSVPGMPVPHPVVVTYRHKTRTAMLDWLKRTAGRPDVVTLGEVIVEVEGLHDDGGNAVAYSPAVLAILLENYPVAHDELFQGYLRELAEAKKKT